MGGVAGHLQHLYDNRDLTFNQMKKILTSASRGELVGTEKTDGFNIYLGIKDAAAGWAPAYARNKGDMQTGGKTFADLAAREFAGGENVKNVYLKAFRAYETAIESLSDAERKGIFGEGLNIFYNAEIQGPGASNVVNYDANIISIHHGGHKVYDPETNTLIVVDTAKNQALLDKLINKFEAATFDQDFSVRRTAFLELQALDSDHDLKIALEKIQKAGFSGSMTINEYLEQKLFPQIEQKLSYFSREVMQAVVDKILEKETALSLTQIYKGFPKEQKLVIKEVVQILGPAFIKNAIWPIEEAIHDFAVELLKGLESAYILDNTKELNRLRAEVKDAIKQIQAYTGPGSDEAHEVLAQQLRKIKHHGNINTAVEGFVFQIGDNMYKFTGNFAPANQILGLFKYGRGSVPPVQKQELSEEELDVAASSFKPKRKIAVVPGKFKPPHKGHLQMVEHYAKISDLVVVLISPLDRKTKSGISVNLDKSMRIWQLYLQSVGLGTDKVILAKSPFNSPVQSSYELLAGNIPGIELSAGDLIIPAASNKIDPDSGLPETERFKNFHNTPRDKITPGVMPANVYNYEFTPRDDEGIIMHGRDFREAIDSEDASKLQNFIPQTINAEVVLDIIYDGHQSQKKTLTMEYLSSLVDEVLEENLGKDFAKYYPGLKKIAIKALSLLKRYTPGTEENDQAMLEWHKKMSKSHPWYPAYIDPIKEPEKLIDVLEILSDFSTKSEYGPGGEIIGWNQIGRKEFLPGKFQNWIDRISQGDTSGDLGLFKEWYLKQFIPADLVPRMIKRGEEKKELEKKYGERQKQFIKTGSAKLPCEESYMDKVFRIAKEKGLTPNEVMGFLEEAVVLLKEVTNEKDIQRNLAQVVSNLILKIPEFSALQKDEKEIIGQELLKSLSVLVYDKAKQAEKEIETGQAEKEKLELVPGQIEIEEISAMAAGSVEGYAGKKDKKRRDSLIREEDFVEEIYQYITQGI